MKYLLDTHVLIWRHLSPERLAPEVRAVLQETSNDVCVSIASAWEMSIKARIGKLSVPDTAARLFRDTVAMSAYDVVDISLAHIACLDSLPLHHRDPFDRLLVAQAIVEECVLVTADVQLRAYPTSVLWAPA